ncbi:DNA polymerase IV [Polaribacter dokdonensis]|uniref:DNA polymerase IV n=1 Tax=Polaribacter dokdonensis DSW-5 TaxID=1300348 RepID=A0A0N0UNH7_9FLAO|nr:DNA polymerase IV [Polaribacter dokdonensis]KOY51660.1 DNA polymerase IV [Polaribacter dokdonensis DSW-5]SEE06125.1 DNA polymerase-4 [Polaribacter dokdonensis DSW-5]
MELQPPFRKIIHVDMDAYYASVAELDNPELRGKAIAVGGGGDRGVVSAASYEARKYGVKSAMSNVLAKQKCPHIIFVKSDFARYKELSEQIREIFFEYTDLVEPLSLDEAYLDVTENKKDNPSANEIAREIRQKIYDKTGLRASAGISINKFIAKVASDINKPNGQKTIHPEEVIQFLEELPVNKFYGVGKVTAAKMYNLGIFVGNDLKKKTLEELSLLFGKSGLHYYNIVRGIHKSEVKPNRIRKSVGAERTFRENISSEIYMLDKLNDIADEIEKRMEKSNSKGKTITLKIKYSDFTQQTRSKTVGQFLSKKKEFFSIVKELLYQDKLENSVRLLGLSFSNLNNNIQEPVWVQLQFDFND